MTATKVLIVDDDSDFREIVRDYFTDMGLVVYDAGNGADAVNAAIAQAPDVILLDITLPDMDGYEVCREIKSNERTRDASIIMVSGRDGLQDKLRGFLAGAQKYLAKPLDLEAICETVCSVLPARCGARAAACLLTDAQAEYCVVESLMPAAPMCETGGNVDNAMWKTNGGETKGGRKWGAQ